MSVVKLRHVSFVEAGGLSGLKLAFVDVAVIVANRREETSFLWIDLCEANHFWSQVDQSLIVGSVKEVA